MKNVFKVLGLVALFAVLCFTFVTCDDGGGNNNNENPNAKTVSVGAQVGTLVAGIAGTVTYPVTTVNIADGTYPVTVANRPTGITIGNSGNITISDNAGTLTLVGSTNTAAMTINTLTLTLDGATSGTFNITILGKTVSVGAQVGTMAEGIAGTVTYPVTTNIADGTYSATVENRPTGVTVSGQVTISGNAGTLTLAGDTSTVAGTTDTLTLTLDGATSGTFSIVITHIHTYVYTVTSTSYPAQSIQTCSGCGETTGTARNTEIGDRGPAGGIIFYVATGGITIQGYTGATGSFAEYTAYYLEAAPANETASRWQTAYKLIDGITTWEYTTAKDAGLAASIGVGRKDTQTIVNSAAFAELTDTAAQRCASKTVTVGVTVFNDWFLPSLGELNEFYKLKGQAGVPQTGIPTTGRFWSSSQCYSDAAWTQMFSDGAQSNYDKPNSLNVRAVRAF